MNQIRPGSGAPAAVLAGSLAVFPLLDVLGLLARTGHTGELQVVADGVEARLWVDDSDLLDYPTTAADRLFELASLDDAWFTVSAALPKDRGHVERVPLEPLLAQVAPHVAEWQSLMKALPFGAVARMSPAMPGPEAQIRSDQWRILSLIGTGRPVHEVVDVSDGRPLETLRLIHELAQKELIVVEVPPAGTRRRVRSSSTGRQEPAGAGGPEGQSGTDAVPHGIDVTDVAGLADVADVAEVTGLPDLDDVADLAGSEVVTVAGVADGGDPAEQLDEGGGGRRAGGGGQGATPVGARSTTTPLTAKRTGAVRGVVPDRSQTPPANGVAGSEPAPSPTSRPGRTASTDGEPNGPDEARPQRDERISARVAAAPRRPGHHAVGAYMPPPVTPSFWPVPSTGTAGPDQAG